MLKEINFFSFLLLLPRALLNVSIGFVVFFLITYLSIIGCALQMQNLL